ncbi:hypothetical protein ISR94_02195 [Candidatus Microgenomates bacterium]|nr:hypothetical protein [Candidatus Microgenomates bacterium]
MSEIEITNCANRKLAVAHDNQSVLLALCVPTKDGGLDGTLRSPTILINYDRKSAICYKIDCPFNTSSNSREVIGQLARL